jgi:hypothetical protein
MLLLTTLQIVMFAAVVMNSANKRSKRIPVQKMMPMIVPPAECLEVLQMPMNDGGDRLRG